MSIKRLVTKKYFFEFCYYLRQIAPAILVIIFFELYNVLVQIRLTTSKTKRDIYYSKLVYELPHELPTDLRLRNLGNKQILGKSQI